MSASQPSHAEEMAAGQRFAFGENWAHFLAQVDEARIERAVAGLKARLDTGNLTGRSFLDIGSGSGMFSLAARRLGAEVHSFDYDPRSVACTAELKRRYAAGDTGWQVQEGSVLDNDYLAGLGRFDVVYSWGVLHHTGAMWQALENAIDRVAPDGQLYIALYNDQGRASRMWWWVKHLYVKTPRYLRWLVLLPCYLRLWGPTTLRDLLALRPFRTWRQYRQERGMSPHRDVIDWVGGFPFEVAKPEQVFDFCRQRGFTLTALTTCAGGHGCNEFVFRRLPPLR